MGFEQCNILEVPLYGQIPVSLGISMDKGVSRRFVNIWVAEDITLIVVVQPSFR